MEWMVWQRHWALTMLLLWSLHSMRKQWSLLLQIKMVILLLLPPRIIHVVMWKVTAMVASGWMLQERL